MSTTPHASLPIDAVLPDLLQALTDDNTAVLVAPPGAGKTTRLPLALLAAPWIADRRIIMLEPRRLAARGAASHMAAILGENLGETVGLRARLATAVSSRTRIEVVTEGVFTRMILDDPTLDGIGAVLFDEFHERSLDADLGLTLARDAQAGLRNDLRLLVMSATLDGARVAAVLGDARVIVGTGQMHPVDTRYLGRRPDRPIDETVANAVLQAIATEPGSILVFLPGQAEIARVADRLGQRLSGTDVDIAPLYAGLDLNHQDQAISPAPPGRRKVVLATSIAETSLTIDGIRIVIDAGLARVPLYEPGAGLTRLRTVRVSRAAADQRRGRAGRLQPGICYRLWAEPETQSLLPFNAPEIANADLSRLILDCAAWGVTDPLALSWLDPPPAAALAAARNELLALKAIEPEGRMTALGRAMARLPLPPRFAAMLLRAAAARREQEAADIAAILVERGLGGSDTDLAQRLSSYRNDRSRRAHDMRRLSTQWAKAAAHAAPSIEPLAADNALTRVSSPAAILALAFPDRIAKLRDHGTAYIMANGRAARLDETDPLLRSPYLVVADITGTAAAGRIRLACTLDIADLETLAADRIKTSTTTEFDTNTLSLKHVDHRTLDAITLSRQVRPAKPDAETPAILAAAIVRIGIDRLAWSRAQIQLRQRLAFLARHEPGDWPDLAASALSKNIDPWLTPFLIGKTSLAEITADDLAAALSLLLPHNQNERLQREAPSHFEAPTGNRHPIDYTAEAGPTVSIRVQELYGLNTHPSIAGGKVPLTFELLSPAQRPIQITRDLPGFWAGSWRDVRSDMRGRYPKHEWPETPAEARPTTRAKARPFSNRQ